MYKHSADYSLSFAPYFIEEAQNLEAAYPPQKAASIHDLKPSHY